MNRCMFDNDDDDGHAQCTNTIHGTTLLIGDWIDRSAEPIYLSIIVTLLAAFASLLLSLRLILVASVSRRVSLGAGTSRTIATALASSSSLCFFFSFVFFDRSCHCCCWLHLRLRHE